MDENTWGDEFENCSSPPFPGKLTTPRTLAQKLLQAYVWVEENMQFANEIAEAANCPTQPFVRLPNLSSPSYDKEDALLNVSVPSLYRSWSALRVVRERWDWIYRNFEEDWTNQKCQLHRMMCIKALSVVLETAFLPPEVLEAREEKEKEEERAHLRKALKDLNIPDTLLAALGISPEDAEEEVDFDSLFHGRDEDDE